MVKIRLVREWTDPLGAPHPEGTQVEIDEAMLDQMVAEGFVRIGGDDDPDGMRWS
jgi:hypothetical protein